jgi:hypothetical protein
MLAILFLVLGRPRIRFVWAVASLGVFWLVLVDVFWCVTVLLGLHGGLGGARFALGTCDRLHCWYLGLVGVPLWVMDRGSTSSSLLAFCVLAWGRVVVVARFLSFLSCVWSSF